MEPFTFGETDLEQVAVQTIDLLTPKVVFEKNEFVDSSPAGGGESLGL